MSRAWALQGRCTERQQTQRRNGGQSPLSARRLELRSCVAYLLAQPIAWWWCISPGEVPSWLPSNWRQCVAGSSAVHSRQKSGREDFLVPPAVSRSSPDAELVGVAQ